MTHLYNYGLSDGGDVVIMNEKGPGGSEASITRDEDTATTLYEFSFPAASLGLDDYESGMQIGVGVCVNDRDTQDGQVGQKGWSGWGSVRCGVWQDSQCKRTCESCGRSRWTCQCCFLN